jgi:hypothetical protein
MRLLGFGHAPTKALMKEMADGALGSGAQEEIETAVAYPPWDIVEGPAKRSDDPGDYFDEFSAGLSFTEQNRHEKLRVLFYSLRVFNQATEGIVDIDDRVFTGVANQMFLIERNLQNYRQVIRFREAMWQMIQLPGQNPPLPAVAMWKKKRQPRPF